jgi:hypothetical protein
MAFISGPVKPQVRYLGLTERHRIATGDQPCSAPDALQHLHGGIG